MAHQLVSEHLPFSEARKRFGEGGETPRSYLERCIAKIEENEHTIKAFAHYDFVSARRAADESTKRYRDNRPLSSIDGMPIGVKDIIDTADMPTRMNSAIYRDHVPRWDAACVRVARQGGGVIVGKTVTTEFAVGSTVPTVNPHAPERTPGGSSSGSAAGVAAGMIAAGFGTQTQGSILRPASYCGVVGYKPTFGALSTDGVHPLSRTLDHLGALADNVEDAWLLCRWVAEQAAGAGSMGLSGPINGPVPPQTLTRVGILRTAGFAELDEESLGAFDSILERLRTEGVVVVPPDEDPALDALVKLLDIVPEKILDVGTVEMRWPYLGYLETDPEKVDPRIHELMKRGNALSREDYRQALLFRSELQQRISALRDSYDAFLLPASSGPAPVGHSYTGSRTMLVYGSFIGFPAYSLPVMSVGGLPFGLQLAGFLGEDYRLTKHAKWIETLLTAADA